MVERLILASTSQIRSEMLSNAQVIHHCVPARVDEQSIKRSLAVDEAHPRDIADTLAELKAQKVSNKSPGHLVVGADQILEFEGKLFDKPATSDEAVTHLRAFSASRHKLYTAAVVYLDGEPLWRQVAVSPMVMHALSDGYIEDYVDRNWEEIRYCVGCYQIEKEGIRLFSSIGPDTFAIQGLPLLQLLSYLATRGTIER